MTDFVRFSSIGAIGDMSMGQVAYFKEAIRVKNEKTMAYNKMMEKQQDLQDALNAMDKMEAKVQGGR
jgi:hypothetical protein